MRQCFIFVAIATLFCSGTLIAQPKESSHQLPTVFIRAQKNFATDLDAAMIKKHVPVVITENKAKAEYMLQVSEVQRHHVKVGVQIARCLFADCIGIEGSSSVSVSLVRSDDSTVLWAYQVRKGLGGPRSYQSLSEAIAKHLKNDYLRHHPNA